MAQYVSRTPTSKGDTEASVPTRQLPPVKMFDRRSDGDLLGPCPNCGGGEWWDNGGRKRSGQMPDHRPDYVCVACRFELHESDHPGWRPEVTLVESTARGQTSERRPNTCAATTKAGKPCKSPPMWGSDRCGPHTDMLR